MTGERALVGILDWEEVGRIQRRGEEEGHSKPWEERLPLCAHQEEWALIGRGSWTNLGKSSDVAWGNWNMVWRN